MSNGTRFSWRFSGQCHMIFLLLSPLSLTELCSFWYSAQVSRQGCPWPLKLMTSQRVERTRIHMGGYRRFRGEWVKDVDIWLPKISRASQKSFRIRTSRIWNCLEDELDLSPSTLSSFKSVIFNYYKSTLAVSYDCKDPRLFKSICLKCNSARPLSRPITCCT